VTVVPADATAWRLRVEYLLDHAPPCGLGDPLRLDHDQVSACALMLKLTSCKRDSNSAMMSPEGGSDLATADLTRVLDEAAVRYDLLPHAHTQTAAAEAEALGLAAADVAKTLAVKTPDGDLRACLI
jgi:hypothetical protein